MLKNEICSIGWNPSVVHIAMLELLHFSMYNTRYLNGNCSAPLYTGPFIIFTLVYPNLGCGRSIKALRVKEYVLLEYFNRALHINVLKFLNTGWDNRGSTILNTNKAY